MAVFRMEIDASRHASHVCTHGNKYVNGNIFEQIVSRSLVFDDPAHVRQRQADVQDDQGPGPVMPAPADPQHIAEQENPEAGKAPRGRARPHEPGRQQRSGHGGPLQQFNEVGHGASRLRGA
ncbi:hypothetical protein D3C72_1249900 [compost metagenome]